MDIETSLLISSLILFLLGSSGIVIGSEVKSIPTVLVGIFLFIASVILLYISKIVFVFYYN